MIKIKKFFFVFFILAMPVVSLAQNVVLVPCDNSAGQPCNFNALMTLVNNIINFILYYMAIPIAAIMFAYAGFLLVTAGGEAAGARTKAKSIFTNAVIGLILAVACWLIVKLILSTLAPAGSFSWIGF
jgi:hypothetical protein